MFALTNTDDWMFALAVGLLFLAIVVILAVAFYSRLWKLFAPVDDPEQVPIQEGRVLGKYQKLSWDIANSPVWTIARWISVAMVAAAFVFAIIGLILI